eukprot:5601062-Amphidinium_carterae.1
MRKLYMFSTMQGGRIATTSDSSGKANHTRRTRWYAAHITSDSRGSDLNIPTLAKATYCNGLRESMGLPYFTSIPAHEDTSPVLDRVIDMCKELILGGHTLLPGTALLEANNFLSS